MRHRIRTNATSISPAARHLPPSRRRQLLRTSACSLGADWSDRQFLRTKGGPATSAQAADIEARAKLDKRRASCPSLSSAAQLCLRVLSGSGAGRAHGAATGAQTASDVGSFTSRRGNGGPLPSHGGVGALPRLHAASVINDLAHCVPCPTAEVGQKWGNPPADQAFAGSKPAVFNAASTATAAASGAPLSGAGVFASSCKICPCLFSATLP